MKTEKNTYYQTDVIRQKMCFFTYESPAQETNSSFFYYFLPSRFSSSYSESGTTTPAPTTTSTTGFSRKNSMVDLNGIADMTKRINETLARHV